MKRSFLETLFEAPPTSRASRKDYDPKMQHERLSWAVHSASCQHVGNFNTYYHMSLEQFEVLYAIVGSVLERCAIKASNATRMGPVEGRVKFACTLRILFGEKIKKFGTDFSCLNCKRQACVQRRSGCYCEL